MKKFLLMITIFLCMGTTVLAVDRQNYNTSWEDNYIGLENIKMILEHFEFTNYTDESVNAIYDAFITSYSRFKSEYPNIALYNLVFWQQQATINSYTGIYYTIGNGTFADESIPYVSLQYSREGLDSVKWSNSSTSTGFTNKQAYLGGSSLINYQGSIETSNFTVEEINSNYYIDGKISSFFPTYTIVYRDDWGFLFNNLDGLLVAENEYLTNPYEPVLPEEPSGDLSGDYTEQLDKIQGTLNNIENKIPSSGDIQQATQNGVVQGNTEYWGSSGDLSGDEQEVLIENELNDFIGTMSGDIAQNEIFGILQTYEDKLFGSFTGEEDFKISWDNISYMGSIIIPSGEVNFSKICRENESLGKVKSTINIILTFIILMNIITYMYNLLLATLGIDNPYLYEKPIGSVTVAEYTDEKGNTYTTTTQHDGRGNSISRRHQNSVGGSSNSRKIGFEVPQYKRWWR